MRRKRKVMEDRENGGGGEDEETEREGERLAILSVCRAVGPPPLLPSSLVPSFAVLA